MYALKGSDRFYKGGLETSSSHDTDTKSGPNTHQHAIYSSKKFNQDSVKENGLKRKNYGCVDACICMPIIVVGGFK